jgi:hypothetical protein
VSGDDTTTIIDFRLTRAPSGALVLTTAGGEIHEGVLPVRPFPISAPDEGFSLVTSAGREIAWIDRLADLPADARVLVEEALATREFLPEIRRLVAVSSFATPSTWTVETDRGATVFVLAGEDDIRRMTVSMLLVSDANGVQYLVRDHRSLDRASRKLLDRFL